MKIVILDGYAGNPGDLSWDDLKTLGEVTVYDRTAAVDTVKRAKDADVVLTNKTLMMRAEIAQLPRLKYIGVLATGYNIVDTEVARERGIVVTNIPAYSTDSVAQMVMAHLLTVTNHVERYAEKNRAGAWTRCRDFCYMDGPMTELSGKTMGIVGLGHIGLRVAQVAMAMGMNVAAVTSKEVNDLPTGIQKMTLEGLLASSHVLSLHCPLTEQTRHMINAATIDRMKPSAIVINTGRGALVDEKAMAEALCEGRIAAYCADVVSEEPMTADNPLLGLDNAYLTPHIAWATVEARQRLITIAVDNVRAFVAGTPQNRV